MDGTTSHVGQVRYYGQFDPPVDAFLHQRYFSHNPRDGVLIECGAFDGQTECSGKFFEEYLDWTCYNLEASPRIFQSLETNRPRAINHNVALSDRIGEGTFYDVHHPDFPMCTNGSIKHTKEHLQWLHAARCELKPQIISMTTFEAFVTGMGIERIDLMVLDVEGHELEVLAGFEGSPVLPEILFVEHGQLGMDVIRRAVEPLGYHFDAQHFVNSVFLRNK